VGGFTTNSKPIVKMEDPEVVTQGRKAASVASDPDPFLVLCNMQYKKDVAVKI
jgi:hypothetical protein